MIDGGKLLSATGSLAETFGAEQPFRYRGYVYDEETGFYYLQSRYYNPELGRFISADVYLSTGQGVIGHNAYAYCGNNPTIRVDIEGDWWQVIAAAIGAVVNVTSQLVTDIITSVATSGEVHLSSWQTYVGAAIGGAAEGFVFACTGNSVLAGAVGSGLETLATEGLTKLTDSSYDKNWGEIAFDTMASSAAGAYSGKFGDSLPKIKIRGLNVGRNSFSAVFKSGITKLKNRTARRMSIKVMAKGLAATMFEDLPYNLIINIISNDWEGE